jgi:membrane carboxypeptidase/penicillin-binding protein
MNVVFFCVMVAVFAVVHLLLYLLLWGLQRELAKIDELSRKRIDALRQVQAQQVELIEKYEELRRNLRR